MSKGFGTLIDEIIKEGMKKMIKDILRKSITQKEVNDLEYNRTTERLRSYVFTDVELSKLSEMTFEDCYFKNCDFADGEFQEAVFNQCSFSECIFDRADFEKSTFQDCHLNDCSVRFTKFRRATFNKVNFHTNNLFSADFFKAFLKRVHFYEGSLKLASFSKSMGNKVEFVAVDLRGTDFSQSYGINMSPIAYLKEKFTTSKRGIIVYKAFGQFYQPNPGWVIKPGKIIKEAVNPDRTVDCGSGVNVGNIEWIRNNIDSNQDIWECVIRWNWLPGVVVPYNTDGKIRSERVQLLRIIQKGV